MMPRPDKAVSKRFSAPFLLILLLALTRIGHAADSSLELSRAVRSKEFLPVVGKRSALLGNETGRLEAWVYPLKIVRNFHLSFHVDDRVLPAEALAQTVVVRPESSTIVFSGDTFSVRETLFVPVEEPGVIVSLEVDTAQPLEIEASFERDFQLEWPAALGGTYIDWDPNLHAFYLGEEGKKCAALVGAPAAIEARLEYFTSSSAARESSFRLGVIKKGHETRTIIIAASLQGRTDAESTFRHLASESANLLRQSSEYYRAYLNRTVALELPDAQLQNAYDWSRISMVQGLVNNPFLGTGLVAGYRTSGDGQRPGFAWFFGRDALWTSLALDASGDFASTRTALEFLSKYQRADGKITHEISQAANFVPWFTDYPYAYASADATPLFLLAANDYVTHSGDLSFARDHWDSFWKAYQFLRSTYDPRGFPQNSGVGHGWIEGGPLLPIRAEIYQVGLGAAALEALAHMATLIGKNDTTHELMQGFARQRTFLNQDLWSEERRIFSFALDADYKPVNVPSVLSTVPMWFGLLDEDKAEAMIDELAGPDHETDWGMRIISAQDPRYSPGGYHFGSVWPLFTGWASVGEYRYHRVLPAYFNLRANSLLALDGALGHTTEVLSGDYYESLSTSSPHQIWSAAMVVSPILRGMLGLEVDATSHHLTFRPHVPADWTFFRVHNLKVGDVILDLTYRKTRSEITLEVQRAGSGDCLIDFAPALSLRAKVLAVEINNHRVTIQSKQSGSDQHVQVRFPAGSGRNVVSLRVRDDFGLVPASSLPPLGSQSRGLKVLSESWNPQRTRLVVNVAGLAGTEYDLAIWNPDQVVSIEGADLTKSNENHGLVRVKLPSGESNSYLRHAIIFHFRKGGAVVSGPG